MSYSLSPFFSTPHSRSDIQKRYRDRRKAESGNFMRRQRERKWKAYVPVFLLNDLEAKKKRPVTLARNITKKKKANVLEHNSKTRSRSNNDNITLNVSIDFIKKATKRVKVANVIMQ